MEALRLAAISLLLVAAFGFVVAGLFGNRVKKVSIGGVDMSPFTTSRARIGALVLGLVLGVAALLLAAAEPSPPPPPPSPSPTARPTASVAPTNTPVAATSPSPSQAVTPSSRPPSEPPIPTADVPVVAEWALAKRSQLEVIGIFLGDASGITQDADDGWHVQGFTNGVVFRSPDEAVFAIRGPVFDRWRLLGRPTTRPANLGFPTADTESTDDSHPWQRFESGAIQCTERGCFLVLGKETVRQWRNHLTEIGYPTDDVKVKLLEFSGAFERGTIRVDMRGRATVCGSDGSTIVGGPIDCGTTPPVAP